jgi:hypothetical protein
MTGQELHQLLLSKWGRSYDLQFRRIHGRLFLQIMWKYLGQASFPKTEAEYLEHLDHLANYLAALEGAEQVRSYITETRDRPRVGRAVSIPLTIDLGQRASEWLLE